MLPRVAHWGAHWACSNKCISTHAPCEFTRTTWSTSYHWCPSVQRLLPGDGWARGKSGPLGSFQGAWKQIPTPHGPRRPVLIWCRLPTRLRSVPYTVSRCIRCQVQVLLESFAVADQGVLHSPFGPLGSVTWVQTAVPPRLEPASSSIPSRSRWAGSPWSPLP